MSLSRDLYKKTFAFWSALCRQGCGVPCYEPTFFSGEEVTSQLDWAYQKEQARRGHNPKPTCDGRLIFGRNSMGKAFVR
jgi:hypothetical protein